MITLAKPGQIIQHDFRNTESRSAAPRGQPVKLLQVRCEMICTKAWASSIAYIHAPSLQWNIERGYKLPDIIAEMQQIQADVIALQEIDIGCKRSGSLDTGEAEQTCAFVSGQASNPAMLGNTSLNADRGKWAMLACRCGNCKGTPAQLCFLLRV